MQSHLVSSQSLCCAAPWPGTSSAVRRPSSACPCPCLSSSVRLYERLVPQHPHCAGLRCAVVALLYPLPRAPLLAISLCSPAPLPPRIDWPAAENTLLTSIHPTLFIPIAPTQRPYPLPQHTAQPYPATTPRGYTSTHSLGRQTPTPSASGTAGESRTDCVARHPNRTDAAVEALCTHGKRTWKPAQGHSAVPDPCLQCMRMPRERRSCALWDDAANQRASKPAARPAPLLVLLDRPPALPARPPATSSVGIFG